MDVRDEAKRILGIRRDIAGAYTESERAKIDGIVLLVTRAVDEAYEKAANIPDAHWVKNHVGCHGCKEAQYLREKILALKSKKDGGGI